MKYFDRIKDTTSTTGTGNITVSGTASSGFRTFSTVLAVADTFYYCIDGGAEWETGIGTIVSSNVFSRSVKESSNSNALVPFSTGTKTVFLTATADFFTEMPINYASFNSAYTATGTEPTGRLYWDTTNHTLSVVLENGVILQIGQENHVYAKNTSGVAISNGNACSLTAVGGTFTTIAKTDATNRASALGFVGLATQDIAINAFGFVTVFGSVHDVNTNGLTEGGNIYVDPATPGLLTQTEPAAPNYVIDVGKVEYAHSVHGRILVQPNTLPRLTDLSDVDGTPLTTTGQILVWNNTAGYWDATENINNKAPLANPAFTGSISLKETGGGSDTITIQAPASIAAGYTLTLPVDDGTPNQVLQTDGSGVLGWTTISGTPGIGDVTGPASATDNAIARFDLTTGKVIQNSGITISDTDQMVIPAGTDYTTAKVRNVIFGTADPTTEGNNGDIYIKVATLP